METKNKSGHKVRIIKAKARLAETQRKELFIRSDFIKLDSALKLADIASTGGHAKILIQEEKIRVNGEICTQRGRKLRSGDSLQYLRTVFEIKSCCGEA